VILVLIARLWVIFAQTSYVSAPHLLQLKGLVLYYQTKLGLFWLLCRVNMRPLPLKRVQKNLGCPVMQMFVVGSISTLKLSWGEPHESWENSSIWAPMPYRGNGELSIVFHTWMPMPFLFTLPITHHTDIPWPPLLYQALISRIICLFFIKCNKPGQTKCHPVAGNEVITVALWYCSHNWVLVQ